MSGEFGSFRFGWDGVNRIGTSTNVLQEATELLPGEVLHAPVPFLPTIVSGDGSTSDDVLITDDGHVIWQQTPAAVDLVFYQGDDVVIPLYFNDPTLMGDDMAASFAWWAQIRRWHSYNSTLVNQFSIKAAYHPSSTVPATEADEYTKVELFLPRTENIYAGYFQWEIYSIALTDLSRFPKPDGVDDADWPPTDALRTWLYGRCAIVQRLTTTDTLPSIDVLPPIDGYQPPAITQNGWVVGPNGRVP